MTELIINSLVVFSLTLLLTKSKIFGGKREFVEERYTAAKTDNQIPGWLHKIWHAIWTCPMCSGFWFALIISLFYPINGYFQDVMVIFGINWLLHCLENLLFYSGETMELLDSLPIATTLDKLQKGFSELTRKTRNKK